MNMQRVPVVLGFDYAHPIGWLEVDVDRLSSRPDYLFSLGFRALRCDEHGISAYELTCITPMQDSHYAAYLQSVREVTP